YGSVADFVAALKPFAPERSLPIIARIARLGPFPGALANTPRSDPSDRSSSPALADSSSRGENRYKFVAATDAPASVNAPTLPVPGESTTLPSKDAAPP